MGFRSASGVRRARLLGVATVLVAAIGAGAPVAAGAATLNVAPGGEDVGDCVVAPCATIGFAVGLAADGDTVSVAAGEYPLAASVVVDKAVTISGAQAGVDARDRELPAAEETVVVPADGATIPGGLIRLSAPGAGVDGFRVEGHTQSAVQLMIGGSGYAVRNSILTDNEAGIDLETADVGAAPTTIEGNRIEANNRTSLESGIYGDGTASNVAIRGNRFLGHVNVPINISGATTTQRDLVIADNSFEGERHLLLLDAEGVAVVGNSFHGGRSQAISVEGGVSDLSIEGNTITDADNAGVIFFDRYDAGPNGSTTISGNTITDTVPGDLPGAPGAAIDVTSQHSGDPGYVGVLEVHANRLVRNSGGGVRNELAEATVAASENWWGCNAGPGAVGCDAVSGAVVVEPNLVLGASATPSLQPGERTLVTASLSRAGDGAPVAGVPNGAAVTFHAEGGSFLPEEATLLGAAASSIFTAGASLGDPRATVRLDDETVAVSLTVLAPPPSPAPPPAPAPPVAPPSPVPQPPTVKPSIAGSKRVPANGQVSIATVGCPFGSCTVATTKPRLKVGGRSFPVRVRVPRRIGSNRPTAVKVFLPKRARNALAGRGAGRLVVRVSVTSSDGVTRTVRVKLKLTAPKPRN